MAEQKIDFFDCASDLEMKEAEKILANRTIIKKEVVSFPSLMIIWEK